MKTFALLCGLAASLQAGEFSHVMAKGDTVGKIVQLYTGRANDWLKPGVRVISAAQAETYPKTEARYRHLFPGDTVVISDSLVSIKRARTFGKKISEICSRLEGEQCLLRLSLLNPGYQPSANTPEIKIPAWFLEKVDFEPFPRPVRNNRATGIEDNSPREAALLALLALGALVILGLYRCRRWPQSLRRQIKKLIAQRGDLADCRIFAGKDDLVICCSHAAAPHIREILDQIGQNHPRHSGHLIRMEDSCTISISR